MTRSARIVLALALFIAGSQPALAQFTQYGAAKGMEDALREMRGQPAPPVQDNQIMVFGGPRRDVYLGCLSCSAVGRDSVLNTVGRYGSTVSQTSIANAVSPYGSTVSRYSACNPLASHPPVVVDTAGRYYGELTMNTTRPDRMSNPPLEQWLAATCRH